MAATTYMCSGVSRIINCLGPRFSSTYYNAIRSRYHGISGLSTAAPTGESNPSGTVPGSQSTEFCEDQLNGKTEPSPAMTALQEENKKILEQVREIDDKYKRSLAENENLRQRMLKQIEDAKLFGIQKFCKDMLEVSDVLSKATESVPKESLTNDNLLLKNLYEGLQMTEAQLQSVFRRHGLTQINPLGERFDPNLHEALFEQVDESKEPGTISVVTKIGYKLHQRVIRPALVGVFKKTGVS